MAGELIDQLLHASRKFSEKGNRPNFDIPLWIMMSTGGWWFVNAAISLEESRERAARGDDPSLFTDQQLREWLLDLVEERQMSEDFLVMGVTRYIEMRLEAIVEDSAKGQMRARRVAAFLENSMMDPEEAASLLEEFNSSQRSGTPPMTIADLPMLLKGFEALASPPSLEDLRMRREELNLWRELAGSLYMRAVQMPVRDPFEES